MTDQNVLLSPDLALNLFSKSSPSQLEPFQLNRSRLSTEVSSQQQQQQQKILLNNNNSLKPSNLSHVPCKFFKQGTCTAGANCTFSHSSDLSSESAVCKYFVKGNCKFGTKCALLHTMSPFGTCSSSSSSTSNTKRNNNNNNIMMIGTPPSLPPLQSSSLSFTTGTTRKTSDQLYSTSLDHCSFLHDPFASSAPATVSLFQQWRNQSSRDFIGLRSSSPRESSDYLLGTSSPFRPSSSLRSSGGGGYFGTSIPIGGDNYPTTSYMSGSHIMEDKQGYDDLNDAMLPSSLNNDLFTPTELHVRRVRQQDSLNNTSNLSSRDVVSHSFDNQQQWRVPFLTKSLQNEYMINQHHQSGAINIPNGSSGSGGGSNSSSSNYSGGMGHHHHSYLQQQQQQDDDEEVQFFMEDDEALTYDTNIKDHKTTSYNFPTLISLPST